MASKPIRHERGKRGATGSTAREKGIEGCDDDDEWWDWDEENYYLTIGAADVEGDEPPESSAPVLWLPDPESRSGWREYYCNGEASEAPKRRIGF